MIPYRLTLVAREQSSSFLGKLELKLVHEREKNQTLMQMTQTSLKDADTRSPVTEARRQVLTKPSTVTHVYSDKQEPYFSDIHNFDGSQLSSLDMSPL